jgi:dipeptidyl aminopeptidase/acylaminoacyl peptidase
MDGPTSDVYLYDVEKQTTRRLTNDLLNVQGVGWSPDGKWILYENVIQPGPNYAGSVLHVVRPDGTQNRELSDGNNYWWWDGIGWLSPRLYLITTQGDGGDPIELRVVDIETNRLTYLWEDMYLDYAIDPENRILAVVGARRDSAAQQYVDYGLYFISADGTAQKITDTIGNVEFLGGKPPLFVGHTDQGSVLIGEDGSVQPVREGAPVDLSVSPDQNWFVRYQNFDYFDKRADGADLYSADGQFVRTISDQEVSLVVWRPDSLGFFFGTDAGWYYIALPDGGPVLMDESIPSRSPDAWLP